MNKRDYFLYIFRKASKKYGRSRKRLAGEGWKENWQTLITTILSAQNRDEVTIPIAENLFREYNTLQKLSNAKYEDVFRIIRSINYNKTKTKHIIEAANFILDEFNGIIPDN